MRSRMSTHRTLSTTSSTPNRPLSRASYARSAVCTNILVGTQPTLMHVPPNVDCSMMPMSKSRVVSSAIEFPDPVPMMTRSWWRIALWCPFRRLSAQQGHGDHRVGAERAQPSYAQQHEPHRPHRRQRLRLEAL